MKVKIQWIGKDSTRMRLEPGGEKIKVEPNQIVEMDQRVAEPLCAAYSDAVLISIVGEEVNMPLATNEVKKKDLKK